MFESPTETKLYVWPRECRAKRLKLVTCKVLQREAYFCASQSQNVVDVAALPQGLHNFPDQLLIEAQKEINNITDCQGRPYDAILIGYGLCCNGTVGLTCDIPMVIPRAHDCITLLLGSKDKYKSYLDTHKGVFWYSPGWIEHNLQPGPDRDEAIEKCYIEKYGKENTAFLMESEKSWLNEYTTATYVSWPQFDRQGYREYTRRCAQHLKLECDFVTGDSGLMQRLLEGSWDESEFQIIEPGKTIAADTLSGKIVTCENCKACKKQEG